MKLKPRLNPRRDELVHYTSVPGGVSITARLLKFSFCIHTIYKPRFLSRGLYYTYPGSKEPALRDINFSLNAGETLAIVGYNGSGLSLSFNFNMF